MAMRLLKLDKTEKVDLHGTIFHLRVPRQKEKMLLMGSMDDAFKLRKDVDLSDGVRPEHLEVNTENLDVEQMIDGLETVIVKIENLPDEFAEMDLSNRDILDAMETQDFWKLAGAAIKLARLSGEQVKNSDRLSDGSLQPPASESAAAQGASPTRESSAS